MNQQQVYANHADEIKQKHLTEFHTLFNAYLTSAPFIKSVHSLVKNTNVKVL